MAHPDCRCRRCNRGQASNRCLAVIKKKRLNRDILAARQDRLPFDRTGGGNQPLPLKEGEPGASGDLDATLRKEERGAGNLL